MGEGDIVVIRIRRRPLRKKAKESEVHQQSATKDIPLSKNLKENIRFISSLYQDSSDVILRSFAIGNKPAAFFISKD